MRWSIRNQFLVPLGLLLLGLVGICTWTAWDSARLARQRIAGQVQGIVHTLGDLRFPLNQQILEHLKGLTGAEYLLFDSSGTRQATLSGQPGQLPTAEAISSEPSRSQLGDRVFVEERGYLCRGVKMRFPNPNAGATL